MKAEDIYDSIGTVEDDLLERCEQRGPKTKETKTGRKITPLKIVLAVGAAAVVGLVVLVVALKLKKGNPNDFTNPKNDPTLKKYVLAGAALPDIIAMPVREDYADSEAGELHYKDDLAEWENAWQDLSKSLKDYGEEQAYNAVKAFTLKYMQAAFSEKTGKNSVFSPVNIYLMLGMLAESTDGNSRAQILELVDAESAVDMRNRSKALWERLYRNSEAEECVLGASVWLSDRDKKIYDRKTLERLASDYYASSFIGKMGSEDYNTAYRQWINNLTGGMLKDKVEDSELDPDTVIALVTTILFHEQWAIPFSESKTYDEVFHATAGDIMFPFMHKTRNGYYYYGETFVAVRMELSNSFMWVILPDEGVDVTEVMNDPALAELLYAKEDDLHVATIHMGLPKFDVTGGTNLIEELQKLGVSDIFDRESANFSQLFTDGGNHCVTKAVHNARVMIDEKGVKAAAYTEVESMRSLPPQYDDLEFMVDRPFLFLVMGDQGNIPLFAGVVEKP